MLEVIKRKSKRIQNMHTTNSTENLGTTSSFYELPTDIPKDLSRNLLQNSKIYIEEPGPKDRVSKNRTGSFCSVISIDYKARVFFTKIALA